jgi:hypothetical protein
MRGGALRSVRVQILQTRRMHAGGGGALCSVRAQILRWVAAGSHNKEHGGAGAGLRGERSERERGGLQRTSAQLRGGKLLQRTHELVWL